MIEHATDATFETLVVDSELPVLVDFWAPWCGPCKMIAPVLDELAEEFAGQVSVVKVNIDETTFLARDNGVRGIPTLLIVKCGCEIDRLVGNQPKAAIEAFIKKNM